MRLLWVLTVVALQGCANTNDDEVRRLAVRLDSLSKAVTVLGARLGAGRSTPSVQVAAAHGESRLRAGDPNGALVLVKFTDYMCPYCAKWAASTFSEITGPYAEAAGLEVVVRNYPIEAIHRGATWIASTVECVADQSPRSALDIYRLLGSSTAPVDSTAFVRLASAGRIPTPAVEQCFTAPDIHPRVSADLAEAARLGLTGTPSFILGRRGGGDSIRGILISGAVPTAELKRLIDSIAQASR